MFKIYKNKRIATKTLFSSYEQARQWVRKQLRKSTDLRNSGQPAVPFALFGYEIRNVA